MPAWWEVAARRLCQGEGRAKAGGSGAGAVVVRGEGVRRRQESVEASSAPPRPQFSRSAAQPRR